MHVSLTEKLDEYVREKVASGLYNNASEVIREALRLKIATEESEDAKLQRLREAVDLGWQQAERGEFADYSLEKSLSRLGLNR
ncbi:MAG: type II toxin-antitoxin system ParD family antitoxin [Rhizobiaceae bacterium]|nr:type II toxin-antitoxin system ParD family antitoxin [Rhizobiaceae bacterium]